jgi:transposase InsO family protein
MSPTPTAKHSQNSACATYASGPYRPPTNGKAERFIQTLLNEWAYERSYGSSAERTALLPLFLERYNYRRPHGSLGHRPPASRLTNVVRNYT